MKKSGYFGLSLLSGLLLWAAWPTSPLTAFIFFAFVPLLLIERHIQKAASFFGYCFLSILLWNVATTWWIGNTTAPESGVVAIVLNSLFMCFPWLFFHKTKNRFGDRIGYVALIAYWLTFEYLHLNWELSWPWLTLGNVFAMHPNWVQWYEWTGSSGGTVWVLLVNVLLVQWISSYGSPQFLATNRKMVVSTLLSILLPLAFGFLLVSLNKFPAKSLDADNIVAVQPNIDPYEEKFATGTQEAQLNKLIQLSESQIDANTKLVVWPETAIPYRLNEAEITNNFFLQPIKVFLAKHPQLRLLSGVDAYRFLKPGEVTKAMRPIPNSTDHYEAYNGAVLLDSNLQANWYHKGKLVPGVEIMPYSWLFGFLEKLALDLGGTSGTLGIGPERIHIDFGKYKTAPIICYESIYSDYVAEYVRNGANVLCIMTNDGWWGNTQGHQQHLHYARLRAIETRRFIVRSANTGISAFIDPLGQLSDLQDWDKAAAIRQNIPPQERQTFFVRMGDYLSKMALAISIILLGWSIWIRIQKIVNKK
jgi:apolipoprotein N-acyltransferase